MDEQKRRYENATRMELRRLVSDGLPPSETALQAFGPWAEYIEPLREAHGGGVDEVRDVFLALTRLEPEIGRLLSSDPKAERAIFTTSDILDADIPPLEWIVPDILPQGLATLAGRPKQGKSWLALQIAVAVGTGGRVLDRPVERRKVLYIALEDGKLRLKNRLRSLRAPRECEANYVLAWPALTRGGLEELEAVIAEEGFSLIVIDTLSRILGRADQLDLAEMTVIMGELQDLTKRTGTAILLIDHHRKPSGLAFNDAIDDIMGSTGKAAIVDVAIGWYRDKVKPEATLKATGRDIVDIELVAAWDGRLSNWHLVGEATEVRNENAQAAILDAIRDLDEIGEVTSTTNIARYVERPQSNVNRELAELVRAGLVVKGEKEGRIVPYLIADGAP